jgi:HSP20 family protein
MASRTTWHPWQEMRRLQSEMEHLLGNLAPTARSAGAGLYPPLNVTRRDDGITVEALCPGADRDSLDVTVVADTVTIRGERKPEPDVPDGRYHRRERPLGGFTRALNLGERLDPERTQATYQSGILRLQLARSPEATPKKIQIQS